MSGAAGAAAGGGAAACWAAICWSYCSWSWAAYFCCWWCWTLPLTAEAVPTTAAVRMIGRPRLLIPMSVLLDVFWVSAGRTVGRDDLVHRFGRDGEASKELAAGVHERVAEGDCPRVLEQKDAG